MTNKPKYNPKIHHRRSIRIQGYDYSKAGFYFITLCCHKRKRLFGKIEIVTEDHQPQAKMILSEGGKIAKECWLAIPDHFPNAVLHAYVIMPDHIHGIIEIRAARAENFLPEATAPSAPGAVGAENLLPRTKRNEYQKMIPKSICSMVKGFKIGVTKWYRKNTEIEIVWHRNYYESIIRSHRSFQRVTNYIIKNPSKWATDKLPAR